MQASDNGYSPPYGRNVYRSDRHRRHQLLRTGKRLSLYCKETICRFSTCTDNFCCLIPCIFNDSKSTPDYKLVSFYNPPGRDLDRRAETDCWDMPMLLDGAAMGVTYKAFDVDLRYPVTLKVISERYLGDESAHLRFLREARAAAKVRHTNVASVFHLGRTGSNYFYAMEFVEGEILQKLIKRT